MEKQQLLTSDLIYGFVNSLLIPRFDSPKQTPDFHPTLWELMCDEHDRVAVAAPRGHAKSTAVTHSYVLANICFRVKRNILIVSDTESQAVNFLRGIKEEFLENEELINLFEVDCLKVDNQTEIVIRFKDGHLCHVMVKGSGQNVRGTTWRNARPDLIVGDDLENDEIVLNEERRHKFKEWFFNALLPCGSDTCQIRIVGTILHMDSLLENLMPHRDHKDFEKHELYEKSTDNDGIWKRIRFKAHNEDYSEILWPEKFSEKRLKMIRQGYINMGIPEGYSQEYLNYPIDENTAFFKKRDFLSLSESDGPLEYYASADLAISDKNYRAFTVFCVAAVDARNKIKFVEVVRFRGDTLEIIDEMFRIQNIYTPECFFLEQENIARSLGPVLNKEMQERDNYINIIAIPPTQDKRKRAAPLQSRMRAGMVEFDTNAEWFPEFQQELLQFPRGKYSDQVDSAAWIGLGLDKMKDVPTKDEWENELYEQEIEESFDFFNDFGRNPITGY